MHMPRLLAKGMAPRGYAVCTEGLHFSTFHFYCLFVLAKPLAIQSHIILYAIDLWGARILQQKARVKTQKTVDVAETQHSYQTFGLVWHYMRQLCGALNWYYIHMHVYICPDPGLAVQYHDLRNDVTEGKGPCLRGIDSCVDCFFTCIYFLL